MQTVELTDEMFEGVVSVEHTPQAIRPWRLPCDKLDLYPAPGDSLVARARESSGVRLRFQTDTARVGLSFLPLPVAPVTPPHTLDLVVDGELLETVEVADGETSVTFNAIPEGEPIVEIWLPHDSSIDITRLSIDPGASAKPIRDERPKWVTYGSSLTHCRRAHSPARTWPAIVARRLDLNVTALGYGGNCCLEPMVGIMIRELPADFISLKLGINCISGALSPRTFAAAVTGLVAIIRERQPNTPMAVISPIGYPPHETTPNVVGNTIQQMRRDIEQVVAVFEARGDANLYGFNGLDVFSLEEIAEHTEDQCHPDADGIELMAENFLKAVMANVPPLVRG